jgi:hypothetical protein
MRKWGLHLVLVAALSLAGAAWGANGRASSVSIELEGQLSGISNFFAPACTPVTGVCSRFSIEGAIKGNGVAFVDTFPSAEGLSHAHSVIHTKRGDLTCSEIAIFEGRQARVWPPVGRESGGAATGVTRGGLLCCCRWRSPPLL